MTSVFSVVTPWRTLQNRMFYIRNSGGRFFNVSEALICHLFCDNLTTVTTSTHSVSGCLSRHSNKPYGISWCIVQELGRRCVPAAHLLTAPPLHSHSFKPPPARGTASPSPGLPPCLSTAHTAWAQMKDFRVSVDVYTSASTSISACCFTGKSKKSNSEGAPPKVLCWQDVSGFRFWWTGALAAILSLCRSFFST